MSSLLWLYFVQGRDKLGMGVHRIYPLVTINWTLRWSVILVRIGADRDRGHWFCTIITIHWHLCHWKISPKRISDNSPSPHTHPHPQKNTYKFYTKFFNLGWANVDLNRAPLGYNWFLLCYREKQRLSYARFTPGLHYVPLGHSNHVCPKPSALWNVSYFPSIFKFIDEALLSGQGFVNSIHDQVCHVRP